MDLPGLRSNTGSVLSEFASVKKIHNFVKMDVDKVKYWAEISDYDLDTAEAMFQTKRWLYVGFMCHQPLVPQPYQHRPELRTERPDVRGTEIVHQRDNAAEHRIKIPFLQESNRGRVV